MLQTGGLEELHDQPAGTLLEIQVECLVFDEFAVGQAFHQHESVANLRDVLIIEHETLHSVLHSAAFLSAAVDYPV